jgi:hypothetical protein
MTHIIAADHADAGVPPIVGRAAHMPVIIDQRLADTAAAAAAAAAAADELLQLSRPLGACGRGAVLAAAAVHVQQPGCAPSSAQGCSSSSSSSSTSGMLVLQCGTSAVLQLTFDELLQLCGDATVADVADAPADERPDAAAAAGAAGGGGAVRGQRRCLSMRRQALVALFL